mmetsp:Transcript_19551/g.60270  ORF Transcript_19551/g.60270 Transcript_19551/m.60270 type:complete len:404 (-) Transcript_19551:25-1236(-)
MDARADRQGHRPRPPDRAHLRRHLSTTKVQDRRHGGRRQLHRRLHQRHWHRGEGGLIGRQRVCWRRPRADARQGDDVRARGVAARLLHRRGVGARAQGHRRDAARPRQPRGPRERAAQVPRPHARPGRVCRARRVVPRRAHQTGRGPEAVALQRLDGLARAGRRQLVSRPELRAGPRPRLRRARVAPVADVPAGLRGRGRRGLDPVSHPVHRLAEHPARPQGHDRGADGQAQHIAGRGDRPAHAPVDGVPRAAALRPGGHGGGALHADAHHPDTERARPFRTGRRRDHDADDGLPQRLRAAVHGRARVRRRRQGVVPDLRRRLARAHARRLRVQGAPEGQDDRAHARAALRHVARRAPRRDGGLRRLLQARRPARARRVCRGLHVHVDDHGVRSRAVQNEGGS